LSLCFAQGCVEATRLGPLLASPVTRQVRGGGTALVLPVTPAVSLISVTPLDGTALTLSDLSLDPATGMVNVWIMPVFWFFLKLMALLFGTVWLRASLPRLRYDQLMDLGWKRFIPISLANILVTALVVWMLVKP
jgi:NADH:ubiquinone oxidoreductase subunit H